MTKSSCDRTYGLPGYPTCSGHAIECLDNRCICQNGWTSVGDFQPIHGYDCDINTIVIRTWSSVNVSLAVIGLLVMLYYLYQSDMCAPDLTWKLRLQKAQKTRNKGILANIIVAIASILCEASVLWNQEKNIMGKSYIRSLSFLLMALAFTTSGTGFVQIMTCFLNDYSRLLDSARRANFIEAAKWMTYLTPKAPVTIFLMLLVIYFLSINMPNRYTDLYCIFAGATMLLAYIFYALCFEYIIYVFMTEVAAFLKQYPPNETSSNKILQSIRVNTSGSTERNTSTSNELVVLHKKMTIANKVLVSFFVNGILLNVAFTSWYFLRRKTSYLMSCQMMFIQVMGPFCTWAITKISKNKSIVSRMSRKDGYFSSKSRVSSLLMSSRKRRVQDKKLEPKVVPVHKAQEDRVLEIHNDEPA